jgi:hypothetical protein
MARQEMRLVKERRLADLISPPKGSGVLEASGVVARGADLYVIFDNVRHVARIDRSLSPSSKRHAWFGRRRAGDGYEDIAYSAANRRFYLLIEAEKHADGSYKPLIDECDEDGNFKGRRWVDIAFAKRNTGLEGLATVAWQGAEYLLALCEGNRCLAGKEGRKGGAGRIHVLMRKGPIWISLAKIKLPKTVDFEDYSAIALKGDRIAVISQMDSKLWIGRLRRGSWTIEGAGRIYEFPRTKKGNPRYCTLEGLCWLSNTRFVLVSDLSKRTYRKGCRKTEQSIHIFDLPGRGR